MSSRSSRHRSSEAPRSPVVLDQVPAKSSSNKHVTIGIVQTESFSPWMRTAGLGAKSAGAGDGNAKVVVQGPVNATAAAAVTIAQNLATSLDPDGMGVNPCILAGW